MLVTTKLHCLSLCSPDVWPWLALAPFQPHKIRLSIMTLLGAPDSYHKPSSILLLPSQCRIIAMVSPSYAAETGHADPRAGALGSLPCFYSHCCVWQEREMYCSPKQEARGLQVNTAPHTTKGQSSPRLPCKKPNSPHSCWICSCCRSIADQADILLNENARWRITYIMLYHYWGKKKNVLCMQRKNLKNRNKTANNDHFCAIGLRAGQWVLYSVKHFAPYIIFKN